MSASYVESWVNEAIRGHEFRGVIDNRDLAMKPQEVIARVKAELVSTIVNRMMEKLGPRIDEAILKAWSKDEAY